MLWSKDLEEAETLQRNGLALVQQELEAHGLGFEMKMVAEVVPKLRENPRLEEAHRSMEALTWFKSEWPGSYTMGKWKDTGKVEALKRLPVLDVELFAALLYTGTDAQGDIRRALREPIDHRELADGWRWTIAALRHLVIKLAERPPEWLYHGLNNVRMPGRGDLYGSSWLSYNNLVSGSMSVKMARLFGKGEKGTVAASSKYGTVLHFDMGRSRGVLAADMRWISKFGDEQEWLTIPVHVCAGLYLGNARSEPQDGGGELLHQLCYWDI